MPNPVPIPAPDALPADVVRTLWALFTRIGTHWQNLADPAPLQSAWEAFVQNRIATDPGHAAAYAEAAAWLEARGEAGFDAALAPAAPGDDAVLTRLRRRVLGEFIAFQLASGGFKAFGAVNYPGYFGGPNIPGRPPYRTPGGAS